MNFHLAKNVTLAASIGLALLAGCAPAPTASRTPATNAQPTNTGGGFVGGGQANVGGGTSGIIGGSAGNVTTAPLSAPNADVATDDSEMQGYDLAAETVDSGATAYEVQDVDASASADASASGDVNASATVGASTTVSPSPRPSYAPPAKKIAAALARQIRLRRQRELQAKLKHMTKEERQVYRLLHNPNIPWTDNHDGTKTKEVTVDFTRSLPGGKTLSRHLDIKRTVDATDEHLVFGETKVSDTFPAGGTKTTDWTKTLQADGSYHVTFTSDRQFADGPDRKAVWDKTIAADGNVSGTGTITWTRKNGTVASTEKISFGGSEEQPAAPTSTKADGTAPEASPEPVPTAEPDTSAT